MIATSVGATHWSQVAADAQYVYTTADTGLYRADKATAVLATVVVAKKDVVGVAVDPSHVYFSVMSDKTIYRYKK